MFLEMGVTLCCQNVSKLRTDLEEREKTFLRQATADLENADVWSNQKGSLFTKILPACFYSLQRYVEASEAYNRLLSEYVPETNPDRIPLIKSIAASYEAAGDLGKADSVLNRLQKAFPNEKGVRSKRAELFGQQADFKHAYQMLREEADLDPKVGEQPGASLALSLGEIAHDRSSGDLSSAIAKCILDRNPAVGIVIDALHEEYWLTYSRLSDQAREEWRMGTTLLHYLSAIEPSQRSKAKQDSIRNFAKSVELQLRTLFIEFRKSKQEAWAGKPPDDFVLRIESELQSKFVKAIKSLSPELRLTLGEMCGLLSCHPKARSALLQEFHTWLQSRCPSLVEKTKLIEEINKVRNPATRASVDPSQERELIAKCRRALTAIRG